MPDKYAIIRIRYNPETDDYDEIPTIWDADTRGEAEGIVARLNAWTEGDCFTIASI